MIYFISYNNGRVVSYGYNSGETSGVSQVESEEIFQDFDSFKQRVIELGLEEPTEPVVTEQALPITQESSIEIDSTSKEQTENIR